METAASRVDGSQSLLVVRSYLGGHRSEISRRARDFSEGGEVNARAAMMLSGTARVALSIALATSLLACGGGSDESGSVAAANQATPGPAVTAISVGTTGGPKRLGATAVVGAPPPEPLVSQLIVKYRDETVRTFSASSGQKRAAGLSKSAGRVIAYRRPMSGLAHVYELPEPMLTSEAFALAKRIELEDTSVEYAEPDYVEMPLLTPNDTLFASNMWHMKAPDSSVFQAGGINAPLAWDTATGQGVVVAVIDTGIRPHPDLSANIIGGYDFITDPTSSGDGDGRDADPTDQGDWAPADLCFPGSPARPTSSWHGTHVAGTVAALGGNGVGVVGVAYAARVIALRSLGRCGGLSSDTTDAIAWAAGAAIPGVPSNPNPARVINLSLGSAPPATCPASRQAAINFARASGAAVVAATGNDFASIIGQPANCNGVIAVTAHTYQGDSANYANVGPGTTISAPGGGNCTTPDGASFTCLTRTPFIETYVWSTIDTGTTSPVGPGYAGLTWTGTSMATPHVSGIAALLLSRMPTLSPQEVQFLLTSSARPFPAGLYCAVFNDGRCGAGLADAKAAIDRLADRSPSLAISAPTLVAGGQTATLTATATARNGGSGAFSYSWQQTAGPAVMLNSTTGATVSFSAPNPGGTHTFRVTVTDGNGYTSTQTATVRTNNAPSTPMASPIGPYTVAIDGTLSFNVSATDPESDVLTYVATNLPAGASFTAVTGAFTWANAGPTGTYNVEVRANDGIVNSAPLSIMIQVRANSAPIAIAGPDLHVRSGTVVRLSGAGSHDPDNGPSPLSYRWTKAFGPSVRLTGAHTPTAVLTPQTPGTYVIRLVVSDGALDSQPALIRLVVRP